MFRITTLCICLFLLTASATSSSSRRPDASREYGSPARTGSRTQAGPSPAWVNSQPLLGWPAPASNSEAKLGPAALESEFESEANAAGLMRASHRELAEEEASLPDILLEQDNSRAARQQGSMTDAGVDAARFPLLDSQFLSQRLRSLFSKREDKTRCMLGRVYRPCWQT